MLKIGLTGGIGSGKSAAAAKFSSLGIPVIDADVSARAVVEIGSAGLSTLIKRFGSNILNSNGALNRHRLREIVFTDDKARLDLEAILHPLIHHHMWSQLEQLESAYVIFDIPLLFETKQDQVMDRVLVIDCPEQLQIERVCQRDGISKAQAESIIQAQIPQQERLKGAHDVIHNKGSLDELNHQVKKLHYEYLKRSNSFS